MKAVKWLTMIIVATTILCTIGCGGGDDNQDSIVGTWRVISNNGKPIVNDVAIFTFNEDGTMESYSNVSTQVFRGTYTTTDGALTVISTGEPSTVPYELNGDTLTLFSTGGYLILERQ